MRIAIAFVITASLLALTACSGNKEPEKIRVTVTQTVSATPSEEAKPKSDGPLKLGAKQDIEEPDAGIHFTVQAIAYKQPAVGVTPPDASEGGDEWAVIDVKFCTIKGGIKVSQFPWSLAYEDGTSIEVTGSTGGDMPKPEFPMDKAVAPGRCAAGKIAFPVPSDKRPERIVYETDGSDPTEWAVGKA